MQLQLPDKESTKGATPLAKVFQVLVPKKTLKPKLNVKWQTQGWFPRILGRSASSGETQPLRNTYNIKGRKRFP